MGKKVNYVCKAYLHMKCI